MKKYPHLFIMGEQGVDVDSTVISGLPWMGMQAGVWDPGFEPLNSVRNSRNLQFIAVLQG